jgi:hypothetical protein
MVMERYELHGVKVYELNIREAIQDHDLPRDHQPARRRFTRLWEAPLGHPCRVPGEIEPMGHNPAIKCKHETTRQYQTNACFLAPLSAAAAAPRQEGRNDCSGGRADCRR